MSKINIFQGIDDCIKYAMKKHKRGGKRKGSGRKKGEPTKVMRVPVSLMSHVQMLIKNK